jgi:ATP-dependent Lhr-like helicase
VSRGEDIALAAADPLNLCGVLAPGPRVPAAPRNRVLYRDGVPVAVYVSGEVQWLVPSDPRQEWPARNLLIRRDRDRLNLHGPSRQI